MENGENKFRGKGKPHGSISRPNVKEIRWNVNGKIKIRYLKSISGNRTKRKKGIKALKQFIHTGCFIVSPIKRHDWMDPEILPEQIISISTEIGKIIPINWQEILKEEFVSASDKNEIDNWVNVNLEKRRIIWPNIYSSVDVAKEFTDRFISNKVSIKIIELGIEKNDAAELIEDSSYSDLGEIERILTLKKILRLSPCEILGFDILGVEHGYFTSYLINHFEKELIHRVGLNINCHGLISDYRKAMNGANYLVNESSGGELLL